MRTFILALALLVLGVHVSEETVIYHLVDPLLEEDGVRLLLSHFLHLPKLGNPLI